jgi:adenylate cyclase
VFADMRKFTSLVRHVPLEDLRAFLNDFFKLFADVIFRFKGTLDKYLGDAALAVFGAPVSHNDPINAAALASIEIHKRFHDIRKTWSAGNKYFEQAGLGIGISSGEVFLGNVGSEKRLDYTVIGTAVNVAQRLASEAFSSQILVTENVKNALRPEFLVSKESNLLLRGFEKPMPIHSVSIVEKN